MSDVSDASAIATHAAPVTESSGGEADAGVAAPPPVASESTSAARAEACGTTASAEGGNAAAEGVALGLRRSDRLFIGVLAVIAVGLMLVHWVRLSRWGNEPIEIDRQESQWYEFRVEMNTATWVEWVQLDGIGETLAQRIVADREANGPFASVDDLGRVKGIGPKTIEKLRPWLRVGAVEAGEGAAQ